MHTKKTFSDTEYNEIKILIFELAEDKDAAEEIEALSCESEVQWWSLKDKISESSISTEINTILLKSVFNRPVQAVEPLMKH